VTSNFSVSDRVATLSAIKGGLLNLDAVFDVSHGTGSSSNYVIVNSIPKSGTYLAIELLKTFGEHADVGYHAYTNGISNLNADGSMEPVRPVLDALWTAALKPGQCCAAHLEYDPVIENYLISRSDHKMIMMVRDPRDLVISWVDFVYNSSSYPKMNRWNAFAKQQGLRCYPDDFGQIMSTIENLPRSGITEFLGWIASPACLVVRFEDLFSELHSISKCEPTPTLHKIADYLGISKSKLDNAPSARGRGLTESGRAKKVGSYIDRMSQAHIQALRNDEFQKLVIGLGYEPTSPAADQSRARTLEDKQKNKIEELEVRIEELEVKSEGLGAALEEAKKEVENLESLFAERAEDAARQIASLTNSTSWRITRPLRLLSAALRAARVRAPLLPDQSQASGL
jgi:hypothetical protein